MTQPSPEVLAAAETWKRYRADPTVLSFMLEGQSLTVAAIAIGKAADALADFSLSILADAEASFQARCSHTLNCKEPTMHVLSSPIPQGATMAWVAMEKQPICPGGVAQVIIRDSKEAEYWGPTGEDGRALLYEWRMPVPQPGGQIGWREEWTVGDVGSDEVGPTVDIYYKHALNACYWNTTEAEQGRMRQLLRHLEVYGDGGDNWQPATTQPLWSIRPRATVKRVVRACRARSLTDAEIDACGYRFNPLAIKGDDCNQWGFLIEIERA